MEIGDRIIDPVTFPEIVGAIGKAAAQRAHDAHTGESRLPAKRSKEEPRLKSTAETRKANPLAYQKALELASGDPRRLIIQEDGSVIVANKIPNHLLRYDER